MKEGLCGFGSSSACEYVFRHFTKVEGFSFGEIPMKKTLKMKPGEETRNELNNIRKSDV
eukprot:m.27678 g.27678  ORF g.27678 m.27678 type:complete len:59 (+) comp30272_c0_seq1:225-401(+)